MHLVAQNVEGEDIKSVHGLIAKERGRKTIVITYTWTVSRIKTFSIAC